MANSCGSPQQANADTHGPMSDSPRSMNDDSVKMDCIHGLSDADMHGDSDVTSHHRMSSELSEGECDSDYSDRPSRQFSKRKRSRSPYSDSESGPSSSDFSQDDGPSSSKQTRTHLTGLKGRFNPVANSDVNSWSFTPL